MKAKTSFSTLIFTVLAESLSDGIASKKKRPYMKPTHTHASHSLSTHLFYFLPAEGFKKEINSRFVTEYKKSLMWHHQMVKYFVASPPPEIIENSETDTFLLTVWPRDS